MKSVLKEQLEIALGKIDRPGVFCVQGSAPAVLPGLDVPPIGLIGLPLGAHQAEELKKRCAQAPYGKGTETVVDTSVRKVWRLDPTQFSLANPAWNDFIRATAAKVQTELGLEEQELHAHLYDLLLYEKGSFFLPHKDGEKLERMVATLVIVLPSAHEEGELIVRHDGREQTVDFASASSNRFEIHYAAFYADCEHEVRPLRAGYRLCLVYNLTLAKAEAPIEAPRATEQINEISTILRAWPDADEVDKLVIMMKHQYTEKGLSWDALKGVDRAVADILAKATEQANCRTYLGLLTFWESGSASPDGSDYDYHRRGRRSYRDDDEEEDDSDIAGKYEMDEVIDSSLSAKHCTDRTGKASPFDEIRIEEEELLDAEALRNVKPKEEFEGHTGNAGMTLERWYHHAALIVWPESKTFDVVCGQSASAGVNLLKELVEKWRNAKDKEHPKFKAQALQLANAVADQWRANHHGRGTVQKADDFFPLLAKLDDVALIARYFSELMLKDVALDPGPELIDVCERHGWQTFEPSLRALAKGTTVVNLTQIALLLERLGAVKKRTESWLHICEEFDHALIQTLIAYDSDTKTPDWQRRQLNRRELIPLLMRAFMAFEQSDSLSRLVDHILTATNEYPFQTFHLPVLNEMQPWIKANVKKHNGGLFQWVTRCRSQLQTLTGEAPKKPSDNRRPASAKCKCAQCQELNQFLADPIEGVHRFRVLQERRKHLQAIITNDNCDIDCTTDRKGSPHTLVCTKNTKSYQAALKKYYEDLKHLEKMREIEAALPK